MRRLIPGESYALILSEFEALVNEMKSLQPDLKVELTEATGLSKPLEISPDSAIAQAAIASAQRTIGHAKFCGAPWGSDASTLSHLAGVPCVVLGPDSVVKHGHSPNESVSLDAVAQAARIYEELAIDFGNRLRAT